MKKRFFHFLTIFCVCLCCAPFFTSCGDDDDEPKDGDLVKKLQGTWQFELMKISVLGQTMEFTADELKQQGGYAGFYDETLDFNGDKVNGLAYSVDKNNILLPWYVEEQWWAQVSFSGSRMTMYYDVTYQGVNMQLWTTYVKSGSRTATSLPAEADLQRLIPMLLESTRP